MLKRMILSGAAVSALGMFFLGRDALSYVGTSLGWIKDSVKNSVPIDFEIQRARRMIKDLVPDIRCNMQLIAKEEVEVEHLDKQIAKLKLESMGVSIDKLTPDQEHYLASWDEGT